MEKKVLPGTLKESYEQMNKAAADLKAWQDRVHNNEETMDNEKWDLWNKLTDEYLGLKKHIQNLELMEKLSFEQAKAEIDKKIEPEKKRTEEQVFEQYVRFGGVNSEDQETLAGLARKGQNIMGTTKAVTDPQSTTTSAGGYLIPQGFQAELDKAMLPFWSQFELCRMLPTGSGNNIPWPTVNDTSNKGVLIAENSEATVKNITFGQITIYAYMFSSYIVKTSIQLLQDTAIPLEGVLSDLLAERLGRILADYFTTGSGSSQPEGIVTGATSSGASSVAATAITRNNILDLIMSVNSVYRDRPSSVLMMADSTLKAILKLTFGTADDRPLWQAGDIRVGAPNTIEGKRYYINDSMSAIGAGNTSMIFGDMQKFIIRRVLGTNLFVFREKYMEYLQIAFLAYCRWDSRMLDAGTHPIKKLVHSAT